MEKLNEVVIAVIGVAIIGKIAWSWLKDGRLEKGIYVKLGDCVQTRKDCCLPEVKRNYTGMHSDFESFKARTDNRLTSVEERMEQGRNDFNALRNEIAKIQHGLTRIETILEYVLDSKHKEEVNS